MQKTSNKQDQEGLKNYADMTNYTLCQARLVATIKQCATTNFVQLLSSC